MINVDTVFSAESFLDALAIGDGKRITYELLGQGEYNINYLFRHPQTDEKWVLRITTGSQMHLDNQIKYEYDALKLLEKSGRTPQPLYIDDTKSIIPFGFLVMEYLPGRALRYETDLDIAAHCLADIHNLEISQDNHLLRPENPLDAILDECKEMAKVYLESDLGAPETKERIIDLLKRGQHLIGNQRDLGRRCLINTELNSGNFLINGEHHDNYIIDWEKPLFAYPEQDLGHFLAPTTTFWKTDTILEKTAIEQFLHTYCKYSETCNDPDLLWNNTLPYFTMTCLRGITWCSMAWVEYQSPERLIKNQFTYDKIQSYLSEDFLERIKNEYIR